MKWERTEAGPQAEMFLIEANGDEHWLRCLARPDGKTDIFGNTEELFYLNNRYTPKIICSLARGVAEAIR